MLRLCQSGRFAVLFSSLVLISAAASQGGGEDKKAEKVAEPITRGQRVFTCGHSFHVFVPGIVADLAKKAEIKDHMQVGMSSIGGSRIIQHWQVPDEKNKAKDALKTGK